MGTVVAGGAEVTDDNDCDDDGIVEKMTSVAVRAPGEVKGDDVAVWLPIGDVAVRTLDKVVFV